MRSKLLFKLVYLWIWASPEDSASGQKYVIFCGRYAVSDSLFEVLV